MSVTISANLVKDLREKTGAGMMECKKALEKAEGNMDKAIKILRESGAAKAAKRDARKAAEGLVDIAINDAGTAGALAELNSETDFVARNEEFKGITRALAVTALAEKATDAGAFGSKLLKGYSKSVGEVVADLRAKIGEKIENSRVAYLEADVVTGYIHPPGKIGVLIGAKLDGAKPTEEIVEALRGIAMHIAATAPRFLRQDQVDAKTLESEKDIFANIARKEGKSEDIIPKIVEGRIKSFYKENCLVSQVYVKDNKLTIKQVVDEAAKNAGGKAEITAFIRLQVGETSEADGGSTE